MDKGGRARHLAKVKQYTFLYKNMLRGLLQHHISENLLVEIKSAQTDSTFDHAENGAKSGAQGETCWVKGLHVQQPKANKIDPSEIIETPKLPGSQRKQATPGSKQPHADMGYYFGFLKPLAMVGWPFP